MPDRRPADEITNDLKPLNPNNKKIEYKGFKVGFYRWHIAGDTVNDAIIQFSRRSTTFGFIENKKVLKFLKDVVTSACADMKKPYSDVKSWDSRHGLTIKQFSSANAVSPEFVVELVYEPNSEGQDTRRTGPHNDFIVIKFSRC